MYLSVAMPTRENRHFTRRGRQVRVTIGSVSSFTIDVGEGGFSTVTMRALPPGSEVEGSIQVDGREIGFGGEVVWVVRHDGELGVRRRMGVRFTRVPWDLQRLLSAP